MIIFHASWLNGSLRLWAERKQEPIPTRPTRRGRKPKARPLAPCAFDAGESFLREAFAAVAVGDGLRPEALKTDCAWLPTLGGEPLASSPLVADRPQSSQEPVLAPWGVTAASLSWPQTTTLLRLALAGDKLAQGVFAGRDLLWWGELFRLAAALVGQGAFLPDLQEADSQGQDGRFLARWRPMPSAAGRERLAALSEAMPGSARSLTDAAEPAPPVDSPAAVASAFLEWAVDNLVRGALSAGRPASDRRRARKAFDSVHDAWLHALGAEDPVIPWADAGETAALAKTLRAWRHPLVVATQAPVRLCFRLDEPASPEVAEGVSTDADSLWRVRYLLQPVADRSLFVEAGEAWRPRSRKTSLLRKTAGMSPGQLTEYLLTALGQAARLVPAVAESLRATHPGGYDLSTGEAHAFLVQDAPALEAAGFGVLLPAWWTGQGAKKRLTLRAQVKSPAMRSVAGLNRQAVAAVDWRLALGDEELDPTDILGLAALKSPLVRLRGTWVELDAGQLKAAAAFLAKRQGAPLTADEAVRLALGAGSDDLALPLSSVTADGWIGELLDRLRDARLLEPVPPPQGLAGTLRPYQARGLAWLAFLRRWGLGACLADDMGLGKTIQTLALVARERQAGETRPTLLVCPTSLVANWLKEAARFTPDLAVLVHHGAGRGRRESFRDQAAAHGLVVSSYALLHRDLEFLREVPWAGLILDEAQNVKNPESKQSRAARAIPAEWRVALTGTPVENHVGDLWAIMEFLNPGLLGSQAAFRKRFHAPIQTRGDEAAAERLKGIVGPFILRRVKTDASIISDLPEKQEMKVYCVLTREQASLYAAVLQEAERQIEDTDGIQRKGVILATLARLKQVCNHPAQFLGDHSAVEGRSGKLARLTETLAEVVDAGERALVFTQFAAMGEILKGHLEETLGREALFLHGGVPKAKRDRQVERFQSGDGPPVFILSLKAGGVGLNLTAANHVFHYDRWWNPAVENQATDRAFRIGQTRNVQVRKFICAGTLEERIDELIERKTAVTGRVIGAGEGWLTELSGADLRRVLALGREATGD